MVKITLTLLFLVSAAAISVVNKKPCRDIWGGNSCPEPEVKPPEPEPDHRSKTGSCFPHCRDGGFDPSGKWIPNEVVEDPAVVERRKWPFGVPFGDMTKKWIGGQADIPENAPQDVFQRREQREARERAQQEAREKREQEEAYYKKHEWERPQAQPEEEQNFFPNPFRRKGKGKGKYKNHVPPGEYTNPNFPYMGEAVNWLPPIE